MPLWCLNQLSVRAHSRKAQIELNSFRDISMDENGYFSLNKTFPIPSGVFRKASINNSVRAVAKAEISKLNSKRLAESENIECERKHLSWLKQLEALLLDKSYSNLNENELANLKDFGAIDEFDWCEKNWGCKYDANGSSTIKDKKSIFEVQFMTPWDLPYLWLGKVSSDYPHLKFTVLW